MKAVLRFCVRHYERAHTTDLHTVRPHAGPGVDISQRYAAPPYEPRSRHNCRPPHAHSDALCPARRAHAKQKRGSSVDPVTMRRSLVALLLCLHHAMAQDSSTVLIIGSGIAGIACARRCVMSGAARNDVPSGARLKLNQLDAAPKLRVAFRAAGTNCSVCCGLPRPSITCPPHLRLCGCTPPSTPTPFLVLLAAPCRLIDAGIRNVTILEARARKGGRLFTANIGVRPIRRTLAAL